MSVRHIDDMTPAMKAKIQEDIERIILAFPAKTSNSQNVPGGVFSAIPDWYVAMASSQTLIKKEKLKIKDPTMDIGSHEWKNFDHSPRVDQIPIALPK